MKAVEFLRGKTFYVATIKDGKPIMRPFGAVAEFEGKLYISTANTKEVYKQIIANPHICISACGADREWVRISGEAKLDERTAAKQAMLDSNPILTERKRFTGTDDPTMAVFYINNMEVEFS